MGAAVHEEVEEEVVAAVGRVDGVIHSRSFRLSAHRRARRTMHVVVLYAS